MSDWHPILATSEPSPGIWHMINPTGRTYAVIRFVRRGGELGYRADTDTGGLVGYYKSLRGACMAAHGAFIAAHGQGGPVNGIV